MPKQLNTSRIMLNSKMKYTIQNIKYTIQKLTNRFTSKSVRNKLQIIPRCTDNKTWRQLTYYISILCTLTNNYRTHIHRVTIT